MDSDHWLVVTPIRLRLTKQTRLLSRQELYVKLLLQEQGKTDNMETIEKRFAIREGHGSIEERWSKLKKAVLESAQKHLQGRSKKQSCQTRPLKLLRLSKGRFCDGINSEKVQGGRRSTGTCVKE